MNDTPTQGSRLKQIRLQKGISLEEVHKKTKIHMNILQAIEDDNLNVVSSVYIRGFLKIYCKFLGVNPAEVIPDYKEPQGQIQLKITEFQSSPIPASLFRKNFITRIKNFVPLRLIRKNLPFVIGVLLFILVAFSLIKLISSKHNKLTVATAPKASASSLAILEKEKKEARVVQKTASKKVDTVSTAPQETRSKASGDSSGAVLPSSIKLIIRAQEDCYIQVKTDGHTVFQGTLKKGRFETWQAKEKIIFSLGNAGAVSLEVNGRPIPSIGRKGQSLKNITITKDGLAIP